MQKRPYWVGKIRGEQAQIVEEVLDRRNLLFDLYNPVKLFCRVALFAYELQKRYSPEELKHCALYHIMLDTTPTITPEGLPRLKRVDFPGDYSIRKFFEKSYLNETTAQGGVT